MGTLSGKKLLTAGNKRGGRMGVRTLARATLFLLILITCAICQAQSAEQKIKAAFLYHFCSYVQWPQHVASDDHIDITIGVTGTLKTVRFIKDALETKSHNKCIFHVRAVKPSDNLGDIQILYVTQKSRFSLNDFHSLEHAPPILTITDEEKNSNKSMINFVIRDDQVRFVISKSRADQAGLKLSSELLAVALQVN